MTNSGAGPNGIAPVTGLAYTQDQLIQALGKYGERWQIQQADDHDGWVAVERIQPVTPPDPRVITDKSLGGLVLKLKERTK